MQRRFGTRAAAIGFLVFGVWGCGARAVPITTPTGGQGYALSCHTDRLKCVEAGLEHCGRQGMHVLTEHRSWLGPQQPKFDMTIGCGLPPAGYSGPVATSDPVPVTPWYVPSAPAVAAQPVAAWSTEANVCSNSVDCPSGYFCKDRGDGIKQCMGHGVRGEACVSSIDCSSGLFCKDRGDGYNACM